MLLGSDLTIDPYSDRCHDSTWSFLRLPRSPPDPSSRDDVFAGNDVSDGNDV